jgi:hypothetical protein
MSGCGKRHIKTVLLLFTAWLPIACSTIDDDLSNCIVPDPEPPVPEEQTYELDYELQLVTNINTEIATQLNTIAEAYIADALRTHLNTVFTDYARDVDLSFYDTENNQERLSHDQHVMNASEKSYTLHLPMREYMHLAAANLRDNSVVELTDDERCPTSKLATIPTGKDTIDSHTTGLFSARLPMRIIEGISQQFHVSLYMANCAEALVLDPRDHDFKEIKVFTTGFATQFHINDSTFSFSEKSPIVRTVKVDSESEELCFYSVNFPSKEKEEMRTVIETEEPFEETASDETLWQIRVYITLENGTVTESILNVREPQRAGQFRIIKGYLGDSGEVKTENQTVGVSVTLNWNDGGNHDVDL